jgi:hypothetical protein
MKSNNSSRFSVILVFLPLVAGCAEDFKAAPPFEKSEYVQVWATNASAVAVYSHAYEPIGVSDGALSFQDPACPETSDDGTTFTILGGCTDSMDRQWSGRATVVRSGDDRELTLDGFEGQDGVVRLTLLEPSLHEFDVSLRLGGGTTIEYVGTIEGDYGGRTVFNGEGHVERWGFFPPIGVVDATTVDEVVDNDVCAGQPVSGTTTLRSSDHTAVIVYDGATDCDPDEKAELVVNDEDRGLVSGISCAILEPGANGASPVPAFLLVAAGFAARLRRSRRN